MPRAKKRTQILLVDDHPIVRERLTELINHEADLAVSGEAEDRNDAIAAISARKPDLAIIDLTLKNSDGLELIKDIKSRWPNVRMLVVSMQDESLYAERVIRAGALGYITKQEATRNILVAIRRVLAGEIYLTDKVSSRIILGLGKHPSPGPATPAEVLTDREFKVFEHIGHGISTNEIAACLHIAPKTVETYRARIKEKLNLKDGNELLQRAIEWVHRR
ncbi:MAG TPA: response regulator transcription factor [Candidatus Paceibacterota bacterium]|nr:response regulator transcription factor [Verrucomicrobiota bacterium]HSA11259.1 response regulator transcription factor [Candidatus Paceibacterota bacterium]